MKKENSRQKEYILEYDMVFMNVFAFVLILVMIGVTYLLHITKLSDLPLSSYIDILSGYKMVILFIVMILWMVLHEIIHGIAYQIGGAKKTDIVYGASIENGVFYCKAKEYINKKCIMTSLLSPLTLIGIVTYIIGIIFSNVWLIALSIMNISGAAGDIMMFCFFLRQKDDVEFRELGFSSPAVIKTSEDITVNKYFGVKNIREVTDQKEVTEGEEKKITITKPTWIFIIVMGVILLIDFLALYLTK